MMLPDFSFVPVLGHELHVTHWGRPENEPLVMWHGLARTGRDFDELAAGLADRYFVLCPDTIGRGLSSWSHAPDTDYSVSHYAHLAAGLLDHFGVQQAGWIGTSMGALIGMWMAAGQHADRLNSLIINDIGPEIPQAAIDRILAYAGVAQSFASLQDAETWLRAAYAPFGPASDRFWQRMTRSSVRRRDANGFTLHFDPQIIRMFTATAHELTTWDRFADIRTPTHVIRGAASDILPTETSDRMTVMGPCPDVTVFQDCGHAPTLSRPDDIAWMRTLLDRLATA